MKAANQPREELGKYRLWVHCPGACLFPGQLMDITACSVLISSRGKCTTQLYFYITEYNGYFTARGSSFAYPYRFPAGLLESQLTEYFGQFGTILDIYLPRDRQ